MSSSVTNPAASVPSGRAAALGLAALLVLAGVLGAALLFAAAMTRPLNYDEDQYLAAGVLTQTMLPYRDFIYLQPPLYPFVLAGVFKAAGGYVVLAGRLVTFALMLGSGVLLWRLVRRLGAAPPQAAVLLLGCLASPFLVAPMGNARNDALPLFLMLAGLSTYLWALERSWWGRAAAALLLGLALEAKVTYLFGPLALGVHALWAPGRRLPPLLLGTAAAAVPAALCYAAAPEAFRFGLLGYHLVAPHDWYGRNGLGDALLLPGKLELLGNWLFLGGNLTLVALAAALAMVAMARRRKWKRPGALLLGLLVGAALLAAVPSPSWAMYFAAVPPLLACCIAHLDRITVNLADPARKRILFAVAALPSLAVVILDLPDLARLSAPGTWTGIAVHQEAEAIRALVPDGVVATLFPAEVLDANRIRPDLASGPFVFRSGAAFPPDQLARLHGLAPAQLDAAFQAAPPAAIYTGLYPTLWRQPMDAPLEKWARAHRWRSTAMGGGLLWLPPP